MDVSERKEMEIYKIEEGEVVFDVDRNEDTIWATQAQIAKLFGVRPQNITTHLKNIYKDGELGEEATCKEILHVGVEGGRTVKRKHKVYNLDAIISVGYRVNSKKATKFRVWATSVLKKYVVNGAAINERRLEKLPAEKLAKLEQALGLVGKLMMKTELEEDEAKGILEVITRYGRSAEVINEFEQGKIPAFLGVRRKLRKNLTIGEVTNLADNLREQMGKKSEFGELKDETEMEKFLTKIETAEGGATVAEKAARLLYYMVKREPFREGNKEIGALLFVYFLTVNDFRLAENGETKMSDRALTAIVLLMSESEVEDEELIVGVVSKILG